jgi:hypothetical protein
MIPPAAVCVAETGTRAKAKPRMLGVVGFAAIWTTINSLQHRHPTIAAPIWLEVFSIAAYAVTCFGLIALAMAIFTANVLLRVPYTLDFVSWYAPGAIAAALSFVAIAARVFYTPLRRADSPQGRPFSVEPSDTERLPPPVGVPPRQPTGPDGRATVWVRLCRAV